MPSKPLITNPPPKSLMPALNQLRSALDEQIPPKKKDNLLIATWNIRELGDLTDKWLAGPNDNPIRDLFSALCIAELLGRFDVIAVQEVQRNLRALRRIIHRLFPRYGFLLTDANNGALGGGERLAFLYDIQRTRPMRVHLRHLSAYVLAKISSRRPGCPGRLSQNRTSAFHIRLFGTAVINPPPAGLRPLLSQVEPELLTRGSDVLGEQPPPLGDRDEPLFGEIRVA